MMPPQGTRHSCFSGLYWARSGFLFLTESRAEETATGGKANGKNKASLKCSPCARGGAGDHPSN